ncbi:MAG TPA: hypothetical protein QGG37_01015 [Chloroflexota bacterium]|nr:hypothetical protein [Chloroflexota bacterium]
MSHDDAVFQEPDIAEALGLIEPVVAELVEDLPACQFSTRRFIEVLLGNDEYSEAYEAALRTFELYRENGLKILHGQVIATALRHQQTLAFVGFVHGEPDHVDPYCHSAWWRKERD